MNPPTNNLRRIIKKKVDPNIFLKKPNNNMKVEVIEFYPNENFEKKSEVLGTFHVYLEEFDIDIKGVTFVKTKKGNFCFLPTKFGFDNNLKKNIWFPTVSFANKNTQKLLIKNINKACSLYINSIRE